LSSHHNSVITITLYRRLIYKEQLIFFQVIDRGAITVKENPRNHYGKWQKA